MLLPLSPHLWQASRRQIDDDDQHAMNSDLNGLGRTAKRILARTRWQAYSSVARTWTKCWRINPATFAYFSEAISASLPFVRRQAHISSTLLVFSGMSQISCIGSSEVQ